MKLRSLLLSSVLIAVATASYADNVVRIGTTSGVTSDSLLALSDEISEQGIDLQVIEFSDWTLPNEALNNCHFQQLLRLNNNCCDNLYVEFT